MAVTPAGTGGSPAAVHISSPHASTWRPRSSGSPIGVHEARTSIWAVPSSSAIPPKLSVATRVTVPDAAVWSAPWVPRASSSHDQPTSASIGSVIMSSSISARA